MLGHVSIELRNSICLMSVTEVPHIRSGSRLKGMVWLIRVAIRKGSFSDDHAKARDIALISYEFPKSQRETSGYLKLNSSC